MARQTRTLDDEVVIVVEKGPRLLSVSESKWAEWTEDLAELECRMFSPKKVEIDISADAIPEGVDVANYDIYTRLEVM